MKVADTDATELIRDLYRAAEKRLEAGDDLQNVATALVLVGAFVLRAGSAECPGFIRLCRFIWHRAPLVVGAALSGERVMLGHPDAPPVGSGDVH